MEKINKSIWGNLKFDLPASLVIYLVALPLCLGVALASTGRSDLLFSGIIAGIIGGIVVGILSGSPLGVSGPAAGLVVIVFSGIGTLGSYEAFLLAVVLAGVIQLLAGLLKGGIIGYYFPSSVIKGMLAAIGLTLIIKEVPHALGFDMKFIPDPILSDQISHNSFSKLFYSFQYNHMGAIVISIVSFIILVLFDLRFMKKFRFFKFLPGALFVVLIGTLINYGYFKLSPELSLSGTDLVQLPVPTSFSDFIGFFKTPDFSAFSNLNVYIIALTIAVVASLETLLCVEAADKLDPYKRTTPTNRELMAQGVGNIVSGLIGGLPITQVIVRSAANINAGGKTKLAAIFHGVIFLVSAIVIPSLLNYIPLACLAVILIMVGYKLSKISLYVSVYKLGLEQFIPFIVTIVAILSTDLLKGIGIGMAVAIFFILKKNYRHLFIYETKIHNKENTITLKLAEDLTFLNKGSIVLTLNNISPDSTLIIDGSGCKNIDLDILEIINDFKKHTALTKNITVETIGIKDL
ncbi:MAG TPA: SulP family inorganic anion transporter [Bacteroidia bacterium]|nr:SulP family inorganic anion transporter [Bacteroidia bacterium]